jgi:hypothetical protein
MGRCMPALGQKRTFHCIWPMSALPPKADIRRGNRDVRFVPKADMPPASRRGSTQKGNVRALWPPNTNVLCVEAKFDHHGGLQANSYRREFSIRIARAMSAKARSNLRMR